MAEMKEIYQGVTIEYEVRSNKWHCFDPDNGIDEYRDSLSAARTYVENKRKARSKGAKKMRRISCFYSTGGGIPKMLPAEITSRKATTRYGGGLDVWITYETTDHRGAKSKERTTTSLYQLYMDNARNRSAREKLDDLRVQIDSAYKEAQEIVAAMDKVTNRDVDAALKEEADTDLLGKPRIDDTEVQS